MGKRGPQKQPTKLRILRGNPGRRKLPKGEPQPPELHDMEPPPDISDDAKAVWFSRLPSLKQMGVATEADRDMFTNYCIAQGAVVNAERMIKAEGAVYWTVTKSGRMQMRSQWVSIRRENMALAKQYAALFGFSPPSRIDLATGKDEPDDEFTQWQNKRGKK